MFLPEYSGAGLKSQGAGRILYFLSRTFAFTLLCRATTLIMLLRTFSMGCLFLVGVGNTVLCKKMDAWNKWLFRLKKYKYLVHSYLDFRETRVHCSWGTWQTPRPPRSRLQSMCTQLLCFGKRSDAAAVTKYEEENVFPWFNALYPSDLTALLCIDSESWPLLF